MDDLDRELLERPSPQCPNARLLACRHDRRVEGNGRGPHRSARRQRHDHLLHHPHRPRSGEAGVRAIVMIEVLGRMADRVADQLRGLPQVSALHSTNGKWDFIAELEDRDLASFDETLRRIRLIDGINTTETNILLKTTKTGF